MSDLLYPRTAPWKCFEGNDIVEGCTLIHPSGEFGKVVFVDNNKAATDQWFVDYGGQTPLARLCLQIGDKGRARRI